ncbi:ABC transporter ATP-binding protein [Nocardioides sp. LHG3406-4]|uniref:ABC transporter ATP-binding protein n=1 Tax=Nocardioides sp. LHG3406-4 TaxID=2804575 RepID=UPI003CE95A74
MSSRTEAVLEVTALRKSYGDVVALDDVSLVVASGESLGVVGESGSGKSTIARLVLGLERAEQGTIVVCGRDRSGRASGRAERLQRAREAQMVFQDPYLSLDPRIRAADCIDEVLRLHGVRDDRQRRDRVRELLERLGLGEREARSLPRELSGGQRQRVAIARALAARPRLLVLDEAVSALDVSVQAQILALLDEIRREEQVAYLFVSHDLAVVRSVTERVLVLHRGKVVETGATEEVLAAPQAAYTRLLLASVPRQGWDLAEIGRARRALQEQS